MSTSQVQRGMFVLRAERDSPNAHAQQARLVSFRVALLQLLGVLTRLQTALTIASIEFHKCWHSEMAPSPVLSLAKLIWLWLASYTASAVVSNPIFNASLRTFWFCMSKFPHSHFLITQHIFFCLVGKHGYRGIYVQLNRFSIFFKKCVICFEQCYQEEMWRKNCDFPHKRY